jgi:hypothetical protein
MPTIYVKTWPRDFLAASSRDLAGRLNAPIVVDWDFLRMIIAGRFGGCALRQEEERGQDKQARRERGPETPL